MPRSIWRGVLSFGMVAIPVRLYLATESSSKVSFNLLCPEHKARIKNKRFCPEGDHEVAWNDVVRAYEYEKGSYVELTDEDLEKLPLRSSKAIDISGFVEKDEIPDDTHFKDLGIDSMMGVEIVAAIERQYKIKIEDAELTEVSTLNKSYDLVKKKIDAAKAA